METKRIVSLEDRLNRYSATMVIFAENLPSTRFGIYMSDQLMRSSISPALNYGEAQGAESRKDFIHKMKVCLKELKETYSSLQVLSYYHQFKEAENKELEKPLKETLELIKIFVASIRTAKTGEQSNT